MRAGRLAGTGGGTEERVDDVEVVREMEGERGYPGVEVPDDLVVAPNIERRDATLADVSSSTGRDADKTGMELCSDAAFSKLPPFDEEASEGLDDREGGGGGGAFLTTAGGLVLLTSGRGVEANPFREGLGGERFGVGGKWD